MLRPFLTLLRPSSFENLRNLHFFSPPLTPIRTCGVLCMNFLRGTWFIEDNLTKGKPVKEAKLLFREQMVNDGQALALRLSGTPPLKEAALLLIGNYWKLFFTMQESWISYFLMKF